MDVIHGLVDEIQEFIAFELKKDFPDITMSGIGIQGNLCLNIGTEKDLTDGQKEEMRRRIAERFIQFIIVEQPVPLS